MSVVVDLDTVVDVLIGREIDGRFTILEKLGGGGMGMVYRAHQHSVDREVAIKVIHANRARDPKAIEAFLREVKLTTRINSPHAVAVLDFGQTLDGLLYLVMELVEGRTLHSVLREDGVFTPARIVRVGMQICEALAAAHALQIVHRDLKPGNIMVLARDFVKVLDFGLATSLAGDIVDEPQTVLGTAAFVAPERARDGSGDSRADLYSLGCVLHALATGAPPFDAADARDTVTMHVTQPIPRAGTMPEPLADVIERLLQKDPADRFRNADETRIALEDAIDPSDLRSSRTNRISAPRFDREGTAVTKLPPRRRKRGFVVAGLILAAGVGVIAFVMTRPSDATPIEQTTPPPPPIAKPEAVVEEPTIEPTPDELSVEPAGKPAPETEATVGPKAEVAVLMRAWILVVLVCGACFSKPQRQAFDDAQVDGSADSADAQDVGACIGVVCVAAGGVCQVDGACHIVTTVIDAKPRCPEAMPCVVECTGDACDGVECGNASACTVHCVGAFACDKQGVDCGQAATCTVRCIGSNACERGQGNAVSVECRNSACDVTCDGMNACAEGINTSNTCTAHCCSGACNGGTDNCVVDSTCS